MRYVRSHHPNCWHRDASARLLVCTARSNALLGRAAAGADRPAILLIVGLAKGRLNPPLSEQEFASSFARLAGFPRASTFPPPRWTQLGAKMRCDKWRQAPGAIYHQTRRHSLLCSNLLIPWSSPLKYLGATWGRAGYHLKGHIAFK